MSEGLSRYHIELDDSQEAAEKRFEKLKQTDVLIMGPADFEERFMGYITRGRETPISTEETGDMHTTFNNDKEGPKILFEDHVSFCTLLLAFNEDGEAMLLHDAMANATVNSGLMMEDLAEKVEQMKSFVQETSGMLLVTGTNTRDIDRERLKRGLNTEDDENIVTLFTAPKLSGRRGLMSGNPANNISAICFVPKELSTDNRNKIFLLATKIGPEIKEEVVSPFALLEQN